MPRHAFKFSKRFHELIRESLQKVFDDLDDRRFPQEPQFTSALLGRLHGLEVKTDEGEYLHIETTNIGDRGRLSAEYLSGADMVITATCGDNTKKVRKAILFQIKQGTLRDMPSSKRKDIKKQIEKMREIVPAPKMGGIRRGNGRAMIEVASGNRFLQGEDFQVVDFPSYFNQRVITTLDGYTDESIVNMLQDGNLPQLRATVYKDEQSLK